MSEEMTIETIMNNTPKVFLPEAAEGVDAIVQFHFTGAQASDWFVTIKNGQCNVDKGINQSPNMSMTIDGDNYVKIIKGELNAMTAFMQGLVVVKGDMSLAMKFPQYFKMGG